MDGIATVHEMPPQQHRLATLGSARLEPTSLHSRIPRENSNLVYERGSSKYGICIKDAYPSTAFDDAKSTSVDLIEVSSGGALEREEFTEEPLEEYIEPD